MASKRLEGVWWRMDLRKRKAAVFFTILALAIALLPSAYGADQFYQPKGYWNYNGSDQGWTMSWDSTGPTAGRQFLRVHFSVGRPSFNLGDSVQSMIRTDGYWFADSGWWYTVQNAQYNISFYYPNSTSLLNVSGNTNQYGIWEDQFLIFLTEDYPMGRYYANATVTGPSTGAPEGNEVDLSGVTVGDQSGHLLVYFDVGGHLNVTMADIPLRVSKNNALSINGTIYQPNGDVFNSTYVEGFGDPFTTYLNVSILTPNGSSNRFSRTTTNGSYAQGYTPTQVGTYYITVYAEHNSTNQFLRGIYSSGRIVEKFISEGDWPETGLGFSQSLHSILALFFVFYLQRKRGG